MRNENGVPELDYILNNMVCVAKMQGWRQVGKYSEIGYLAKEEDCRDFEPSAFQPDVTIQAFCMEHNNWWQLSENNTRSDTTFKGFYDTFKERREEPFAFPKTEAEERDFRIAMGRGQLSMMEEDAREIPVRKIIVEKKDLVLDAAGENMFRVTRQGKDGQKEYMGYCSISDENDLWNLSYGVDDKALSGTVRDGQQVFDKSGNLLPGFEKPEPVKSVKPVVSLEPDDMGKSSQKKSQGRA